MGIWQLLTNPERPKAYRGLRLLGTGVEKRMVLTITGDSLPDGEEVSRSNVIPLTIS